MLCLIDTIIANSTILLMVRMLQDLDTLLNVNYFFFITYLRSYLMTV